MKQNSNRRSRSRGQNKKSHGKNSYDSNGPAGKVRGTAQQVLEKYQVLGRDAAASGDWIAAESCLQYAEHYYRIVNAESNSNGKTQDISGQNNNVGNSGSSSNTVMEVPILPVATENEVSGITQERSPQMSTAEISNDSKNDQTGEANELDDPSRNKSTRRRRLRVKNGSNSSGVET